MTRPGQPGVSRLLPAALAVYFALLSSGMVFLVPPYEAPDENAHLAYVDVVATGGRIPDMRRAGPEGHQPPLYYALAGLVAGLAAPDRCIHINARYNTLHYQHGGSRPEVPEYEHVRSSVWPTRRDAAAFYAVRFMSVLFGTLTVVCAGRAARDMVGGWPGAGLSVLFVATLPELCYISAVINNDALAVLTGAAITLAALGVARRPTSRLAHVWLGAALGVSVAVKKNLLCFWPGAIFLIAYLSWRNAADRRHVLRAAAFGLLAAAAVGGPWLVRNQWTYGDPLGAAVEARMMLGIRQEKPLWSSYFLGAVWTAPGAGLHGLRPVLAAAVMALTAGVLVTGVWLYRAGPARRRGRATFAGALAAVGVAAVLLFPDWIGSRYVGIFWEMVYVSFIGQFGHFKLPLPDWIHQGYAVLFVLGGAGLYVSLRPGDPDNASVFTLALFLGALVAGLVYYNTVYSQAHGRLILPGLAALAVLCGRGWQTLLAALPSRRARFGLALAAAAFFLVADTVTIWRMYAYWYNPPQYGG